MRPPSADQDLAHVHLAPRTHIIGTSQLPHIPEHEKSTKLRNQMYPPMSLFLSVAVLREVVLRSLRIAEG